MTARWNIKERAKAVELYHKNRSSIKLTQREFQRLYNKNAPSGNTIRRLFMNFSNTGTVQDLKRIGKPRSKRTLENLEAVRRSVSLSPRKSVRKRAYQLALNPCTLFRILKMDLNFKAFKIQLVQNL